MYLCSVFSVFSVCIYITCMYVYFAFYEFIFTYYAFVFEFDANVEIFPHVHLRSRRLRWPTTGLEMERLDGALALAHAAMAEEMMGLRRVRNFIHAMCSM